MFPGTEIFNAASASIVVGIMVLPMVASLCDDAFRAVPKSLRQGGFAMGATKFEVAMQIVLPAALSGVLASFILALSRAVVRRWPRRSRPAARRGSPPTR